MSNNSADPLTIHDKLVWGSEEIAACGAGTWGKVILASSPMHTNCSQCLANRVHNGPRYERALSQ